MPIINKTVPLQDKETGQIVRFSPEEAEVQVRSGLFGRPDPAILNRELKSDIAKIYRDERIKIPLLGYDVSPSLAGAASYVSSATGTASDLAIPVLGGAIEAGKNIGSQLDKALGLGKADKRSIGEAFTQGQTTTGYGLNKLYEQNLGSTLLGGLFGVPISSAGSAVAKSALTVAQRAKQFALSAPKIAAQSMATAAPSLLASHIYDAAYENQPFRAESFFLDLAGVGAFSVGLHGAFTAAGEGYGALKGAGKYLTGKALSTEARVTPNQVSGLSSYELGTLLDHGMTKSQIQKLQSQKAYNSNHPNRLVEFTSELLKGKGKEGQRLFVPNNPEQSAVNVINESKDISDYTKAYRAQATGINESRGLYPNMLKIKNLLLGKVFEPLTKSGIVQEKDVAKAVKSQIDLLTSKRELGSIGEAYNILGNIHDELDLSIQNASDQHALSSLHLYALNDGIKDLSEALRTGDYDSSDTLRKSIQTLVTDAKRYTPVSQYDKLANSFKHIDQLIDDSKKNAYSAEELRGVYNELLTFTKSAQKTLNGVSLQLDGTLKHYNSIRRIIDQELGKYYEKSGIPISFGEISNYDDLIKKSAQLKEAEDFLKKGALRGQINTEQEQRSSGLSLSSKIATGITTGASIASGNPLGILVGVAGNVASNSATNTVKGFLHGKSVAAQDRAYALRNKIVTQAPQRHISKIAESARNFLDSSKPSNMDYYSPVIAKMFFGTDDTDKISNAMDQYSTPEAITAHVKSVLNENSPHQTPEERAGAEIVASRALNYLAQTKPAPIAPKVTINPIRDSRPPSRNDVLRYKERIKGALDPNGTMKAISNGHVSRERAEAFKTVYPETSNQLLKLISMGANAVNHPINHNKTLNMQKLTGSPLSDGSIQENVQRIQREAYAQENDQNAQKSQKPSTTQANRLKLGQSDLSQTGRTSYDRAQP